MKATLERARELAAAAGIDAVGTEHVLLAMLEDEEGIAGGTLRRVGAADETKRQLRDLLESDEYRTGSDRVLE